MRSQNRHCRRSLHGQSKPLVSRGLNPTTAIEEVMQQIMYDQSRPETVGR